LPPLATSAVRVAVGELVESLAANTNTLPVVVEVIDLVYATFSAALVPDTAYTAPLYTLADTL
jgi:hypothetical protein